MNQKKSFLQEITLSSKAVKTARSEPIQQETPKKSMDFLRSLINPQPVAESMNIESMLSAQLEAEARKHEISSDPKDHVAFDVPLLMRVFELVREGIKSDVELHQLVERILSLKDKGTLTMDDYETIAGNNPSGTEREHDPITSAKPAGTLQDESINALKQLAGIR